MPSIMLNPILLCFGLCFIFKLLGQFTHQFLVIGCEVFFSGLGVSRDQIYDAPMIDIKVDHPDAAFSSALSRQRALRTPPVSLMTGWASGERYRELHLADLIRKHV